MKAIVVYFSQTGNTRQIAEAIRAGIGELAAACDIARLSEVKGDDLASYDLIGLGSPVWHRREPANVLQFIEYQMKSLEGRHAFTFCTHGIYPGHFIGRVVAALRLEGLVVTGWKDWYGSVWMPDKPKPYFTDGHPDAIDLAEARDFGREIASRSLRVAAGETGLIPALPTGRAYHELYPGPGSTDRASPVPTNGRETLDLIDLWSFDFKVNKEKCLYPRCTLCIDYCPTHSINFTVSPPLFRKNCEKCWYCEQICPRGAIEINWSPMAEYMDRYIIPDWFQAAAEAVARGRLRMHVSLDDVRRAKYWYEQKDPPRLKPL